MAFASDRAPGPEWLATLALVAGLVGPLSGCDDGIQGPSPSLDAQQTDVCGEASQTITLTGSDISPMVVSGADDDAEVELPTVCLFQVEDLDGNPVTAGDCVPGEAENDPTCECIPEEDVTWVSQNELQFTISGQHELAAGFYEVEVTNPNGASTRGEVRIRVVPDAPVVFFADPFVVYSGISTQITLIGNGLTDVGSVALRDADDTETELDFTEFDPSDPRSGNELQAIIPQGTTDGTYDLVVSSEGDCTAELIDGLEVTSTLGLEVTSIEPPFGPTDKPTDVTVTGSGFESVPRIYLNPTDAVTGETIATQVSTVAFNDATTLTGVVPSGLPANTYDVIVVNPDGTVGLLEGAFTISADAPPRVSFITPGTVDNQEAHQVTIEGSNFRNPTVQLTCQEPTTGETVLDGTVDSSSGTQITMTFAADSLEEGTVCVVRVTNDDGTFFDFSAMGITLPAGNRPPFQLQDHSMITPRRALAVESARATEAARFLYAIGGDDGDEANAYMTVESASVDVFGNLGPWFEQPVMLPTARTRAAVARIGRYMYLIGGDDGAGVTGAVNRAKILDPATAPEIITLGASEGADETEGIGSGVWYYRVSAVMADNDPSNPDGETLASDPFVVSLPDSLDGTIVPTLFWEAVPGAQGYRIYRNVDGTEPFGSEVLLAEVEGGDTTSYEDVSGTPSGASPLPVGATGVWMDLPGLMVPRASAGAAAAPDPDNPSTWYVYAMGGRDMNGELLDSVEVLPITIETDGSQTAGADWAGATPLSSARAELGVYEVGNAQSSFVPLGDTVLYAAGGAGTGGGGTNVDAAFVEAGGGLTWAPATSMSPNLQGYGAVAGANRLFAFGGLQGDPSDTEIAALLEDTGGVPGLVNWNNEGVNLNVLRYLTGATVESAFMFVVGGWSAELDGGVLTNFGPTATVERTVL